MLKNLWTKLKTNKKFRCYFIIILLAVVLLISATVYTLLIRPTLSEDKYIYKETEVQFGDLVKGIQESGVISLEESNINYSLDLSNNSDDDDDDDDDDDEETSQYLVVEEVFAVAGQRIKEGDALFKLSSKSIDKVRRKLTARATQAQIDLEDAEADYNLSMISANSTYESSMNKANNAGSLYNATLSSLQAQISKDEADIKVLTEEILMLQEELEDEELYETRSEAAIKYEQAKNKYDETDPNNFGAYASNYESYVSAKNTYDNACDAIDSKLDSIEDKLDEITKLNKDMEDAKEVLSSKQLDAKQTYEYSKAAGETAKDILEYTKTSLNGTVEKAQTTLDETTNLIDEFEAFVGEDGVIYADGSGLVTQVNYEADDELTTSGVMLSYVEEDSYTISIDVLEEDVPDITIGDTVDITFTAYEGETWKGTISAISATATTSGSTVSYPVTIHIDGDTSKLYGGMTADVVFITDKVEKTLYVSRKAIVYDENNNAKVYIQDGSDYILTDVEVGFSDGTNIQVLSGLKEGETVFIQSKVSVDDNSLMNFDMDSEALNTNGESDSENNMPGQENGSGNMPNRGDMPNMGDFPGGAPNMNGQGGFNR